MGEFLSLVRYPGKSNSKIVLGPLKLAFSESDWERDWQQFRNDETDDRLYKSGVWIYRRWKKLHEHRLSLERWFYPGEIRTQLLAWINSESRRLAQVTITEDVMSQPLGPRTLVELGANNPLTREDVVVYLGEAVSQIVNRYPEPEGDITGHYTPQIVLSELGMVHVALAQLTEVWEECLRLDSWIEEVKGASFIRTWDQDYLKSKAIALERQKGDELLTMAAMQHILSRAPYRLKPTIPAVHEATLESGHLRYTLTGDVQDFPLGFSQRKIAESIFPTFIMSIGIAKFGGLTIKELLDAYELLTSLSSLFLQGNLVFSGDRVRLLDADLPKLLVSDLGRLLKEALSWDDNKVSSCLQAFVYRKGSRTRDGGWASPFLSAGETHVELCLPLLTTHPAFLIEHWLTSDKNSEAERGRRYEKNFRESIIRAVDANPVLRSHTRVFRGSLNVRVHQSKRDVDLVARIANTILLAEFKSVARPANSSTEANYVEEVFRKAPNQLAKRINAMKEDKLNLSNLIKATCYDGRPEGVILVPVIVTLHLEGSGCEAQDFPVIDSYSLQEFFASNVYEAGFEFGVRDGISRPTTVMTLYSNAQEAAQNLEKFLKFNPRIAIRNRVLDTTMVESPDFLLGSGGTVVREYCYVKDCTTDEMRRAVMIVADEWRRIVGK